MLEIIPRRIRKLKRYFKYLKYKNYPGLHGRLHANDGMFQGDIDHYISVGQSAMDNIAAALKEANRSFDSLNAVLDIPSGYGRVLRALVTKVSPEKITACELEEGAINFCAKEFGTKKFLSSVNLAELRFPEKYSLIWVGSLFTHLGKEDFTALLKLLYDSLEDKGVLVFTTHGNYSVEMFETYWPKGSVPITRSELQQKLAKGPAFYYAPYPGKTSYGVSISLKEYVVSLINSLFNDKVRILRFAERGWDNHQDVFAIQKLG